MSTYASHNPACQLRPSRDVARIPLYFSLHTHPSMSLAIIISPPSPSVHTNGSCKCPDSRKIGLRAVRGSGLQIRKGGDAERHPSVLMRSVQIRPRLLHQRNRSVNSRSCGIPRRSGRQPAMLHPDSSPAAWMASNLAHPAYYISKLKYCIRAKQWIFLKHIVPGRDKRGDNGEIPCCTIEAMYNLDGE